jgi:2-keto-4-pentenoate hydratase
MHDADQLAEASRLLVDHWDGGTKLAMLPAALCPKTRREGYAIQALLESRSQSPLFGWKIAATSLNGQQHINVSGPLAGRILAERVAPNGGAVSLRGNLMRVAEAEFAFRFAVDLPPRTRPYDIDDVLGAVATLHPAIELPDSRFADFVAAGEANLIADNACAHDFVLGEPTKADWRALDLAEHRVAISLNDDRHVGNGAAVLGDPRIALTWLVNELSGLDLAIKAGQVVTTGTCCIPLPIAPGDVFEADFGVLGQVSVRPTD